MTEIKDCPICQSNNIAICGNYLESFQVGCHDCHIRTGNYRSESLAVAKWNTRATSKDREFLISLSKEPISSGGNGGSAFVAGKNGIAIGGSGGSGNNADMIKKIRKHLDKNP